MFAYCLNNPVCNSDYRGTASVKSLDYATDAESSPVDDMMTGGSALGFVAGLAIGSAFINYAQKKKPINLPSRKKVSIDMDHISSGHMPGGDRNPNGNKDVFWGLTSYEVAKAVMEAYEHSKKLLTQGDRVKLIGYSSSFNLVIEIWVNIVKHVIETAYPK